MNNDKLINLNWFHGTHSETFKKWQFPPPAKINEPAIHTGIFFTSNLNAAKRAGNNIAQVYLNSNIKILNTIYDQENSEKLRLAVIKNNPISTYTANVQYDYWHGGWITGDVLRITLFENSCPFLEKINLLKQMLMKEYFLPEAHANKIALHLSTKYHIEMICVEAKKLGFDAIFGYEVDQHSKLGEKLKQPWLCVFYESKISLPNWIK